LIVGLGILLLQVVMSSGKDLEASGKSFDFEGDAGAAAEPGAAAGPSADAGHGDHGHAGATDGGLVGLFLSFRFWTFALAGFGVVGSALHFPELAGSTATLLSALLVGLFAGLGASWTFRALRTTSVNSGAEGRELVGQVGKVLVPPNSEGHAKVRLVVKGQMIDYVATTDDTTLESGTSVLVEELRGNQIHVSPAPAGLKYSDDQN
jgi:membrane protein implicated in regulation of membrane protease activity